MGACGSARLADDDGARIAPAPQGVAASGDVPTTADEPRPALPPPFSVVWHKGYQAFMFVSVIALSMLPTTFYSIGVYTSKSVEYYGCMSADGRAHLSFSVKNNRIGAWPVAEPFSTATNLSYALAGATVFLIGYLFGTDTYPSMYGLAVLLVMMGTGSAAFHATGSLVEVHLPAWASVWQHDMDRFMMFALFIFTACLSVNGLVKAATGIPDNPRSTVSLIANLCGLAGVAGVILMQGSISDGRMLGGCGAVIIIANAISRGILEVRAHGIHFEPLALRGADGGSARGWLWPFLRAALGSALQRVFLLAVAFWMNGVSMGCNTAATGYVWNPPKVCPVDQAVGVELQKCHDFYHGAWHLLSGIVILTMGFDAQQALSARLPPPLYAMPGGPLWSVLGARHEEAAVVDKLVIDWAAQAAAVLISATLLIVSWIDFSGSEGSGFPVKIGGAFTLYWTGRSFEGWLWVWLVLVLVVILPLAVLFAYALHQYAPLLRAAGPGGHGYARVPGGQTRGRSPHAEGGGPGGDGEPRGGGDIELARRGN